MQKSSPAIARVATDGKNKKLIGRFLVERGMIDEFQLDEALKSQRRSNQELGIELVNLGHIDEDQIARALADIFNLQYVDLDFSIIDPESIKKISVNLARRYNIIPLRKDNGFLHIAGDRLLSPQVMGNLRSLTGSQIVLHIATAGSIRSTFKEIYQKGPELSPSEDSAVIRLVDELIEKALHERASDIHFEPRKKQLNVRFRVDGLLRETGAYPVNIAPLMISRIKILARLNIAEKRSPQDGGFTFKGSNSQVDIRVSTLPNIYGEKAVLRLLATEHKKITFESIGMESDTQETFKDMIKRPHGIILLASPTGSGKSTTLYATLQLLKSETVNITTVEDPVEYKIDGVTQVQVDQAMKVTFSKALRSILRQDPDIIMIGEIRDRETADIALEASLTGHLVLATIHTNDAPSALTRLVDMGCEPFLVSSTVCGVMAQRLIRVNCPDCKAPFKPTRQELEAMGCQFQAQTQTGAQTQSQTQSQTGVEWFRGAGCRRCFNTGYRNRVAIFELLKVDKQIQREIMAGGCSSEKVRATAVQNGMRTLFASGLIKVMQGITTPQEIMRVCLLE